VAFHLAAFGEAIAAAGTLQPITAVGDDQIFTAGDDLRVPTGLNNLLGAFAFGTGITRARIVAPSLRAFINHEIAPLNAGDVPDPDTPKDGNTFVSHPIPLAVGESINLESDAGAAGPEDVFGLVMLDEGPRQPVSGDIRTVRAVAAVAAPRITWLAGALTFSEDLPAGRYQVVGGRCVGANVGAFRLIFRAGGSRPGTMGMSLTDDADVVGSRMGAWGVWGEFDINQPPQIEILGVGAAAAAQVVYLDLLRIG